MAENGKDLENLVNEVSSIDTARMTLRWALEKINNLEKERAELKKNFTLSEDEKNRLQARAAQAEQSFSAKTRSLEEKEEFYNKLEATMQLLGAGKLDIQQLLKKEARLDVVRKQLEEDYQDKFEELDRSQKRSVELWNKRLLDVEGQYAGKLLESQKKFDSLKYELEGDFQKRLTGLEKSYKFKEEELQARVKYLEDSLSEREGKLEFRHAELEKEYSAKKEEMELRFSKMKEILVSNFQNRLDSLNVERKNEIKSLQNGWAAERARLTENAKTLEEQYLLSQEQLKTLEKTLSDLRVNFNDELMKKISENEEQFKKQVRLFENEKDGLYKVNDELRNRLSGLEIRLSEEKERLAVEYSQKIREIEGKFAGDIEEGRNRIAQLQAMLEKKNVEFDARLVEVITAKEAELRTQISSLENAKKAGADEASRLKKELDEKVREVSRLLREKDEEVERRTMEIIRAEREELEKLANSCRRKELESRENAEAFALEKVNSYKKEYEEKEKLFSATLAEQEGKYRDKIKELQDALEKQNSEFDSRLMEVIDKKEKELRKEIARLEESGDSYAQEASKLREILRKKDVETDEKIRNIEIKSREDLAKAAAFYEKREQEIKNGVNAEIDSRVLFYKQEYEREKKQVEAKALEDIGREREKWDGEKQYLEKMIDELTSEYREANEKISTLLSENNSLTTRISDLEVERSREMAHYRAKIEADFSVNLAEAVKAETANLNAQAAACEREITELSKVIRFKNEEAERLKSELSGAEMKMSEKLRNMENHFISKKEEEYKHILDQKQKTLEDRFNNMKSDLYRDYENRRKSLQEEFDSRFAILSGENESLKETVAQLYKSLKSVTDKANSLFFELVKVEDKAREEKASLEADFSRQLGEKTTAAVNEATKYLQEKLDIMQNEIIEIQRSNVREAEMMKTSFNEEKQRMMEELEKREEYIKAYEQKVEQLEDALIDYKKNSAEMVNRQLQDQEEKFSGVLRDSQARHAELEKNYLGQIENLKNLYSARIKQMEEAADALEKNIAEKDEILAGKKKEFAAMETRLNEKMAALDGEMRENRNERAAQEKSLEESKLRLEKEYAKKESEIEKLRIELARAIAKYKGGSK